LTTRTEAVNQSLNLWATLRRALYSMVRADLEGVCAVALLTTERLPMAEQDRPDLAEKAVVGADLGQFRADFDF
jgi:hypothetical protein